MNEILLITNTIKDKEYLRDKCRDYLRQKKINCIEGIFPADCGRMKELLTPQTDVVIILGGDGTIMQVARELSHRDIPLMGINLGTLGFLAEAEPEEIYWALDRIISGDYEVGKRMMLEGYVLRQEKKYNISPALNEINITRMGSMQILSFSIYVNDEHLCNLSADGIIVATPTGSTGYNMSAGGPLVVPDSKAILLTPVCAHNFFSKSIVLGPDDKVSIVIHRSKDGGDIKAECNSDGRDEVNLEVEDTIVVYKSDCTCRLIKFNKDSFLETLQKKMNG